MDDLPDWAVDDTEIVGQRWLLRRVLQARVKNGVPERSNFREDEPGCGLSVTVWDSLQDLEDIRRRHENFGIIAAPASAFRAEAGTVIARAPLVGNLNHCEIFPHFGQGAQKRIRETSRWVHYPDWVEDQHRGEPLNLYADQANCNAVAS